MKGIQKVEWEGKTDGRSNKGYVGWNHMLKGSKSQAEKVKFNMMKLELGNPGWFVSRA